MLNQSLPSSFLNHALQIQWHFLFTGIHRHCCGSCAFRKQSSGVGSSASFLDLAFALRATPHQVVRISRYTTAPRSRLPFFHYISVPGFLSRALPLQLWNTRLRDLKRKALIEGVPGFMAELYVGVALSLEVTTKVFPSAAVFCFWTLRSWLLRLLSDSAFGRCSIFLEHLRYRSSDHLRKLCLIHLHPLGLSLAPLVARKN